MCKTRKWSPRHRDHGLNEAHDDKQNTSDDEEEEQEVLKRLLSRPSPGSPLDMNQLFPAATTTTVPTDAQLNRNNSSRSCVRNCRNEKKSISENIIPPASYAACLSHEMNDVKTAKTAASFVPSSQVSFATSFPSFRQHQENIPNILLNETTASLPYQHKTSFSVANNPDGQANFFPYDPETSSTLPFTRAGSWLDGMSGTGLLQQQQLDRLSKMMGVSPSDIDKYSRVVFPVCFICFNLMYWIIYTHISESTVSDLVPYES